MGVKTRRLRPLWHFPGEDFTFWRIALGYQPQMSAHSGVYSRHFSSAEDEERGTVESSLLGENVKRVSEHR